MFINIFNDLRLSVNYLQPKLIHKIDPRVKSPEGNIRSPDPINWTVPLDTAKTFSVTQSVRDGGQYLSQIVVL
jgi:hypothetical protein